MAHLSSKAARLFAFAVGAFFTTATGGVSAAEMSSRNTGFVSAITEAPDQFRSVARADKTEHDQRTEPVTGNKRASTFLIMALFDLGRPADVARLIVSVVVDPVDAVRRARPRPNVSQKSAEVVAPFGADTNTPASVVFVFGPMSCLAASNHAHPGSVLRRPCAAVPQVVAFNTVPFNAELSPKTAATRGVAGTQTSDGDSRALAANADAPDAPDPALGFSITNNRETTKLNPVEIESWRHAYIISKAYICGTRDNPKVRPVSGGANGNLRLPSGAPA